MYQPYFVQIQSMALIPNYGYSRSPGRDIPRLNADKFPTDIISNRKNINTVLWPVLFNAFPTWKHGLQGTGDCVSWMFAHMADITDATRNLHNPRIRELFQTASESIYAFGKAELFESYKWHRPGMMGIDAIVASEKFGRLFRKLYDGEDLRIYNGERAELWGEDSRKTHGVPDVLEPEAAAHKMLQHLEIDNIQTAAAFIEAGYPVGYCGDTFWGIETDSVGNAQKFSEGAHAMVLTGVQYKNSSPYKFWVANTGHGDHVRFPDTHGATPLSYRECGSWLPSEKIQPVLERGDCFVISVDGVWNIHTLVQACILRDYLY